jgi:prolyl oligopeptidase
MALPIPSYPLALAMLLAVSALAVAVPPGPSGELRLRYPKAPRSGQVDDYHGNAVPDPFRPLEATDAPATRRWIQEENRLTESFLARVPERGEIRRRLLELWDFERLSPPVREGGRLFYTRNDGLSNQPRLYVGGEGDAGARLLLDPNTLSADGTVAMGSWSVSRDGLRLAYSTTDGGSDWTEWHVRDVASGRDLADRIRWVKFSRVAWGQGGAGFYYSRYAEPPAGKERAAVSRNQRLYYHRLGDPQSDDRLIYARPEAPDLGFEPIVSDDGRYLVIQAWRGADRRNRLYYMDLDAAEPKVARLLDSFDALYEFLGNDGPVFFLRTDRDAPRGKIVSVDVDLAAEGKPALRTLVPESDLPIEAASFVGCRFAVTVMEDATHRVRLFARDGAFEREVELPGLGSLAGFSGHSTDPDTFYSFTSFTRPPEVFRYDFGSGRSQTFHRPKPVFDASAFETSQFLVPSRDGTKVPLFVVHRKGLVLDGSHPVLLYGYGGFNVALTPSYSAATVAWLERGGVYAQACVRGGSEYGEEWHRAGMLERKQNSFDDFAAAAEWLVRKGYGAPRRLAIQGASNGGLLVGAVLNQRPELFGAAVVGVGVLDMLRYHKFTIGWAWIPEYGSSDDPVQAKWLEAYSPLHNIRAGASYPAVLVTTGDHDDRVVPGHSFKYAAALQEAQGGDAPVLIRVDVRAGHGAGKPVGKQLDEAADVLTFLTEALRRR